MNIPDGVNWIEFYNAAKAKGIMVQSRFRGVYINKTNGNIAFMVRYQGEGMDKFLGRFPFTKEGELEASKKFEQYLSSNGIKPRHDKHKRPYKKKKP